jgi:hypothetical protein
MPGLIISSSLAKLAVLAVRLVVGVGMLAGTLQGPRAGQPREGL